MDKMANVKVDDWEDFAGLNNLLDQNKRIENTKDTEFRRLTGTDMLDVISNVRHASGTKYSAYMHAILLTTASANNLSNNRAVLPT